MIRGFAVPFIEMKIELIYHPFVVIEDHLSSVAVRPIARVLYFASPRSSRQKVFSRSKVEAISSRFGRESRDKVTPGSRPASRQPRARMFVLHHHLSTSSSTPEPNLPHAVISF